MLQTENLTKIYKTGKGAETIALDNVSLSFGESGLVFILGRSGSGKTTLLNLLGGLIRPTSGDVIIHGKSGKSFKECDYDAYRNTCVGFVFQDYNLIENYTVGTNIKLAPELQGKKVTREEVENVLKKMELTDRSGVTFYDRKVKELSGGQKQRVAIARALIKNPEIILADEPTGALDSQTGEQFYEILKELSGERLVIVVTHDEESAKKYGDRIIEISDGKILNDSNPLSISRIPEEESEKKYIKSKFPLKYALSTGARSLVKSPFRLIASVLITVISLVIFGFMLSVNFCDRREAELRTMRSQNIYNISINERIANDKINLISEYLNGGNWGERRSCNGLYDVNGNSIELISEFNLANYEYRGNPYDDLSYNSLKINNFTELNSLTAEKDVGIIPDGRFEDKKLCKYPVNFNEIAITDVKLDLYIKFGYKSDSGEIFKISKPDDIIGKTIGGYTVCGVYSTEMDRNYFKQYDVDWYRWTEQDFQDHSAGVSVAIDYKNPLSMYLQCVGDTILNDFLVCKGFFEYNLNKNFDCDFLPLPDLIVKISGRSDKDYTFLQELDRDLPAFCYYGYDSGVSKFVRFSIADWTRFNSAFTLVPAVVVGVFAVLLTIYFLITSVDMRNKEIGILRALGAGKSCVSFICLVESVFLGIINFALSVAGTFVVCAVVNAAYYAEVFGVGISIIALLFLASTVFSVLATLFASLTAMHKKEVNIYEAKSCRSKKSNKNI